MLASARRLARLLLFSLTCVIVWLSTSCANPWARLPTLSLKDISLFLDRYEGRVSGLRSGLYEASPINFLKTGVFWIDVSVSDPAEEKEEGGKAVAAAAAEPSLWLQALCIVYSFCILCVVNAGLCYVMCIRYGKILSESGLLLFKCLREADWRSPYQVLCAVYRSLRYASATAVYVWLLIPPRERNMLVLVTAVLVCLICFRVGFGRERLLRLLPLGVTAGVYYCIVMFLSPEVSTLMAAYLGEYIAILWASCIVLRHYRVTRHPSWKLVPRHEITHRSIHEQQCLLDLLLASALIRIVTFIPLVGSFLLRQFYVHHVLCFTSVMMLLHCVVVQCIDNELTSSPLYRLKHIIILWIDTFVHFAVGWPNIVSSRVGSQQRMGGVLRTMFNRLSAILCLIPGYDGDRFSNMRGVTMVLGWVKMVPHLLLLLLPSFVSRLYFEYLTVLAPSIRCVLLPADASFKLQTVAVLNFILADLTRFIIGLITISFLPLKGLAGIGFAAGIDTLMRYIDSVPLEARQAHAE